MKKTLITLFLFSCSIMIFAVQESHDVIVVIPAIDAISVGNSTVEISFPNPTTVPTEGLIGEHISTYDFFTNSTSKKIVVSLDSPLTDPFITIKAQLLVDGNGSGAGTSSGWQSLTTVPQVMVQSISNAHYLDNTLQYRVTLAPGTSLASEAFSVTFEMLDE